MITVQLPRKLQFLLEPHRYKIAHGGRNGLKSWSFARALLLLATKRPLRILCTREIQKSLKESVYKLLEDQISLLGLDSFYSLVESEIRGENGSLFIFSGLSDQTVTSIKSFEGIDIVWVEEAQTVSKRSYDILEPTIRKPGSEIWISFNPELDTDETYVRFVTNPPPGAVVVQTTYRDNPWLSPESEQTRARDEATKSKEDYAHVWEGACLSSVPGAIYTVEVGTLIKEGRYTFCPYDPELKVHTVWDMGFNDACAIGFFQRRTSELRLIRYLESSTRRVDEWALELNKLPYNWGKDWLPHDGYAIGRQTGLTDEQLLRKLGRRVASRLESCPNGAGDVEQGIRATKVMLQKLFIAKEPQEGDLGTARILECLRRYRRAIPKSTMEPAHPVHDEYSHGADMLRQASRVAHKMTNEDEHSVVFSQPQQPIDRGLGHFG